MNAFFTVTEDQQQLIALVGGILCLVHGVRGTLSPEKHYEFYLTEKQEDLKDPVKQESIYSVQRQDCLCAVTCTLEYLLIAYKGLEYYEAVGVTALLWLVLMLAFILNDVPQRTESSPNGFYLNIAVLAFVVYSTLVSDNETAAKSSVKFLATFALAHGAMLFLAPNMHSRFYGANQSESSDMLAFTRRSLGAGLLYNAVLKWALITGMETTMAYGLSWASVLALWPFLLSGFKQFGCDMNKIYGWMVVMGFMVLVLTMDVSTVEGEETEE